MATIVELNLQTRLVVSITRAIPMTVRLTYSSGDPLAVHAYFPAEYSLEPTTTTDPEEVEWVFARQLLAAGIDMPAGLGDVRVMPMSSETVAVELHSAEGKALLLVERRDLSHFLWHTYRVVPVGQEHEYVNTDQALAELLA
ncbi:SsgA family sporulation/cell division regulator [Saccharothrix sp. ST-888]|uniref:SsgA family sporulation/cell division regulator n=1 Tax=Saccharothrix sp. ST-888 TaxID=1427391 RepID=UPI0005EC9E07|nr:SsgA family sporulation/cell division regulator [Saccharothrix sp. ST-888]KJK56127.1 hypothetical protein UK12_24620 [Saccharothrix sp. ST-888]